MDTDVQKNQQYGQNFPKSAKKIIELEIKLMIVKHKTAW